MALPVIDTSSIDSMTGKISDVDITTDYGRGVALGLISNTLPMDKFGYNPSVGSSIEDVWYSGGTYGFFPDTAQSIEAVSSSADDAAAGTGCQVINVRGLDSNWNRIDEDVTLNGTTAVDLTNTYLRIDRVKCLDAGSGGENAGTITVRVDGGGTTAATVAAGVGQTLQAVTTIPAGYKCIICEVKAACGKGEDLEVSLRTRKTGECWQTKWLARTFEGTVNFDGEGCIVVEEKTDIRLTAESQLAGATCAGWIYGYMVRTS